MANHFKNFIRSVITTKRTIPLLLAVLLIFTACGKSPPSTTETIKNHYTTILKTNNTATIRSELAELEKLSKDTTLSDEELMFAKYAYNMAYGIAKLSLSGKSINIFDFPEMELLNATVGGIASGEMEITDEMVSESLKFLQKVENFIK